MTHGITQLCYPILVRTQRNKLLNVYTISMKKTLKLGIYPHLAYATKTKGVKSHNNYLSIFF